jgi:tetratricopeptide (TPR) repeat protein
MPSHIYLRTGNYNKGVSVNEDAVKSYKKTIPLYALVTSADFLYVIHNLHMQTNNAMLAGKQAYSVKSAMETVNSIQEYLAEPGAFGNYVQYIYMTPVLVDIRFGRWNELLSRTKPDPLQPYANVLYHFGTGMALANKADPEGAQIELRRLRQFLNDSSLLLPFSPFSPAIDGALVAENLLAGTIALVKKDHASAIAAFSKAVAIEDSMVYNEPRDWLLNPKQYLGDALLQAAKWEEAEKVFLRDLQNNNENGWALFGLHRSLLLQEKKAEAAKVQARFKKAFDKADVKLSAPVF